MGCFPSILIEKKLCLHLVRRPDFQHKPRTGHGPLQRDRLPQGRVDRLELPQDHTISVPLNSRGGITLKRSHTVQAASSTFLSPSPNSGAEAEKSLTGEQQFDLNDFLYEFGLTLNQIFSLLFGLNLKIEKSDKSDQGGNIKNPEYFLILIQ